MTFQEQGHAITEEDEVRFNKDKSKMQLKKILNSTESKNVDSDDG